MIEKAAAYKTSDGQTHPTLEDAQKHELAALIRPLAGSMTPTADVVNLILANADEVIAILKLKPRKKREAKKPKAPKADKPAKVA
jgi:hypothetical protein